MQREELKKVLNFIYKEDLKNLGYKVGLENVSIRKDDLIDNIMKNYKSNNFDIVFNYLNKEALEIINSQLDLPYSNRKKSELIKQIFNYYDDTSKNKSLDPMKIKGTIVIPTESKRIPIEENPEKLLNHKTSNNNSKISSYEDIVSIIENSEFFEDHIKKSVNETHLRDLLVRNINSKIGTAQPEYPIGGYFDLSIDIDISDGLFGLEIKKWISLKSSTTEISRAIGQAYIYSKKRYKNNNFIFVIFGVEEDRKNQRLIDFEKIIKELNGKVIFKVVKK